MSEVITVHGFASELFALLYLNKSMADDLKGHSLLEGREQLPVEDGGILQFNGTSGDRW